MIESRFKTLQEPISYAEREADPLEEHTRSTSVLLDGKFIQVCRDEVTLPDGRESFRVYLTHPGAAAMIALYEDGTILLERQWRHPVRQSFWEIPAGKLDPNESELDCAKRELAEECGVSAKCWTRLGVIRNAIGYSSEHIAIYLAEELEEGEQHLDPGEFLEVYRVPLESAVAMARDGRITDVKTITAIFWLNELLKDRELRGTNK